MHPHTESRRNGEHNTNPRTDQEKLDKEQEMTKIIRDVPRPDSSQEQMRLCLAKG